MLQNKKALFSLLLPLGFAASLSAPASAAVVTSIKPLGFIAAAIADGVTPVEVLLPDGASEQTLAGRGSRGLDRAGNGGLYQQNRQRISR